MNKPDNSQLPITSLQVRYAIGIDPDLTKNGVAIWDMSLRKIIDHRILTFPRTLKHIGTYSKDSVLVYVEAGWLNKVANFHTVHLPVRMQKASESAKANYIKGVGERISKNVGENHAAGKLLVEMLEEEGYATVLIQPTKAKWKPEDCEKIAGIKTKNQECIDAIRLVCGR
jgi:hypothetical protein